jgi:predicted YcjX-like family ATPase
LISEYGLDPWLVNNNKESFFSLLNNNYNNDNYNNEAYYKLHSLWARRVVLIDTITTVNDYSLNIFDKIRFAFGSTAALFISKITSYI